VLSSVSQLPSGVPLLVDQSSAQPRPGKQFLPGTTVDAIQTITYQFAAAKLAISTFVLPTDKPYELDVRLEGKPYAIRASVIGNVTVQSGAAIATVQKLGTSNPGNYVDVRVPGRVYYR
jgi:hypothetical protein